DWPQRTSSRRVLTIRKGPVPGVTSVINVRGSDPTPLFGDDAARRASSQPSSPATCRNRTADDGRDGHDEDSRELSDEVDANDGVGANLTERQCPWCRGADFWRSRVGQFTCRRCYPPAPGAEASPTTGHDQPTHI